MFSINIENKKNGKRNEHKKILHTYLYLYIVSSNYDSNIVTAVNRSIQLFVFMFLSEYGETNNMFQFYLFFQAINHIVYYTYALFSLLKYSLKMLLALYSHDFVFTHFYYFKIDFIHSIVSIVTL